MNRDSVVWDNLSACDRGILVGYTFTAHGIRLRKEDSRRLRTAKWADLTQAERDALFAVDWQRVLDPASRIDL